MLSGVLFMPAIANAVVFGEFASSSISNDNSNEILFDIYITVITILFIM